MAPAAAGLLILALLTVSPRLPQDRIDPSSAIALWAGVLVLRAVIAISIVLAALFAVPATALFSVLTRWCFHAVMPILESHLGLSGHNVGDLAVLVPATILAVSLFSASLAIWNGARAVRRWLVRDAIGPGPEASTIVAGSDVVVAAAGLRTPTIVISAGALLQLDDAELAAGLAHEMGHVRRRHRFIAMTAELCGAAAKFLPGTRQAVGAIRLHLERDADEYAVRRTGDRLALASAICKAARAHPHGMKGPALASLAGSGISVRLRGLIGEKSGKTSRTARVFARLFALAALAATISLLAALPALGVTWPGVGSTGIEIIRCG